MDFYCLCCGGLTFRGHQLCYYCERLITTYDRGSEKSRVAQLPFAANALWAWGANNNEIFRKLILSLKGGRATGAYKWLAEKLVTNFFIELLEGKRIVLVPAPPQTPNTKDHAFALAAEISKIMAWDVYTGLVRNRSFRQQKNLSRNQRKLKKTLVSEPKLPSPADWLIFVDDVVTTGSTAISAWEVLNRPVNFCFWALAERSRLPHREGSDITRTDGC